MSKGEKFELKWSEVGDLIGYPDHGPFANTPEYDESWFRVHTSDKSLNKEDLAPLYFWKKYAIGFSNGLYPTYDTMHCIFRETLNPKVGNMDEIQGILKNLFVACSSKEDHGHHSKA